MFWYVIGIVFAVFVAFVAWRFTSVARGGAKRDEAVFEIIGPVVEKLQAETEVSKEEVATLAERFEVRPWLYRVLDHHDCNDLFPESLTTWEAQAEGQLAYWLLHPNEANGVPDEIEISERIVRTIDGKPSTFFVMKFKMASDHWLGEDWNIGLAGPYLEDDPPYNRGSAFSRFDDKQGEELIDWYLGMIGVKT